MMNFDDTFETDVPTTIIYSENDPTFTNPLKTAERIARHISNKEVEIIPVYEGGHAALVESPEKYNDVIEQAVAKKFPLRKKE